MRFVGGQASRLVGVVAFVFFIPIDKIEDGAVDPVLFCPKLLIIANIVGVGDYVGVELQLDTGSVIEVPVAVYVVADIACILDGVEVGMYEAAFMW